MMTMRRYLLIGAAMYIIIGCLLLARPIGLDLRVFRLPIPTLWYDIWVAGIALCTGCLKAIAAWKRTPFWQIAAISVGVGVAVFFALETSVEAMFGTGSWTIVVLWVYVALMTEAVIPFASIGHVEMEQVQRATEELIHQQRHGRAVQQSIERRLDKGSAE